MEDSGSGRLDLSCFTGGRAGIIMSSNDVGSYELKRAPYEMQMEECSADLARSTSDGSADY